MAGIYDLTGQNIENTYQRVLQTPDGVNVYDGTGSLFYLGTYNTATGSYGSFYDTAKQAASASSSATAIKFSYEGLLNNINIQSNTSGQPTKITVQHAGVYMVQYTLQIIKPDVGVDEMSVWIRRNGAAYANTHSNFTISGSNIKNLLTGNYLVDLGANDYIELYFSVKNTSSMLCGTNVQTIPSRPATPSAQINLHKLN